MEILIYLSKIALVAICGYASLIVVTKFIGRLTRSGHIDEPYNAIFIAVSKWIIVIVALLFFLQIIGIPISHVFATLSAVLVLVAVGFVAVWSVLSNILCSFLLLLSRPFSFDDEIELKEVDKEKGIRGKVINLNLFFTTLETELNGEDAKQVIRIPNTLFFQRITIVHDKTEGGDLKFGGTTE